MKLKKLRENHRKNNNERQENLDKKARKSARKKQKQTEKHRRAQKNIDLEKHRETKTNIAKIQNKRRERPTCRKNCKNTDKCITTLKIEATLRKTTEKH